MSPSLPVRLWLYIPWIVIVLGSPMIIWWLQEPPPVSIEYVAPAFLSQPAESREAAAQYYVTETVGGGTLWRYVEYCVRRPYNGVNKRAWVSRAIVWQAPDLSTYLSRIVGCHSASLAVEIPQSNPARRFDYAHRLVVEVNPIKTVEIEYTPIPLLILSPAGVK
jgi:hypothetical protein